MVSLNSASGIMSLFSTKLNYRELSRLRYVSGDARHRDRPATYLGDKQIKVSVIRVKMRYSQTPKRSSEHKLSNPAKHDIQTSTARKILTFDPQSADLIEVFVVDMSVHPEQPPKDRLARREEVFRERDAWRG
jgi:hypothetical protein